MGISDNRFNPGTHSRVSMAGSTATKNNNTERIFKRVAMCCCWVFLGIMLGYTWSYFHFAVH
jgi:hypothetical protein